MRRLLDRFGAYCKRRADEMEARAVAAFCAYSPSDEHETEEVCGVGAGGFECHDVCIHCGGIQ